MDIRAISKILGIILLGIGISIIASSWMLSLDYKMDSNMNLVKYENLTKKLQQQQEPKPEIDTLQVGELISQKINEQREKNGLPPLRADSRLATVARMHSSDMAKLDFFEHTNPSGQTPNDRAAMVGFECKKQYGDYYTEGIAENIAYEWLWNKISYVDGVEAARDWNSQEEIAQKIVQSWMESYGHRKNILDERFTLEGTGVAIAENGKVYATQDFC